MFKIDNDVDSVENDDDGDDFGDTDGFLGHYLNMVVDVEGLDPATVATMLESNIMHRTAGDQRKYHYQYQNHYHYHYSLSLSTTCALLQLTKEDHCCNQGNCHQYTPSTDFTAITTNTNKKSTTSSFHNIFKSRDENKTYCHHFMANI